MRDGSTDHVAYAVERVLIAHGAALRRFCLARTRHPSDADDAVQDTLLHFVRHARSERIENPEAWLVAVAARVCHRIVSRRSRWSGDEPELFGEDGDPADTAVERAWVERILAGLQASDRLLLTSLYMHDEATADVAAAMGRPEGTVRWLAHRARARARDVAMQLSGAGAVALAWLAARRLRSPRGAALRARVSAALGHPSLAGLTTGPAFLLLVAGSAGLLPQAMPAFAVASSAPAQIARTAVSAMRLSHAEDDHGSTMLQSAARDPGPPTPIATHPSEPPPAPSPPLGTWVLPSPDPRDAMIEGATASPSYDSDQTVFVWGWPLNCAACNGAVLYRSNDGGHTWTMREAVGYQGGPILLPYDYATSHVVFAENNGGLWRSDDDGRVFLPAVPLQTDGGAAVVPGPGGDSIVVLGGEPPIRYDERSGLASPAPAFPVINSVSQIVYTGSELLVQGQYVPPSQEVGIEDFDPVPYLLTCAPSGAPCDVQRLPTRSPLQVSPAYERDHTVAVLQSSFWGPPPTVEVSTDGGRTFSSLAVPVERANASRALWPYLDSRGRLMLAVEAWWGDRDGLHVAIDTMDARGAPVPFGSAVARSNLVRTVVTLPDGKLLALLTSSDPSGKAGLRCSHDGGATWSVLC